ncbi:hybrid sensor histidine kinase/response regulator transcription factor [Aestuariivivens sediminicola]|uniref:hybrid sensor histidine kinase/response regulator transcription factor n=1 Tax=Aestuariivivens sediminicola TaxID=2913560 RepID=UPI001F5AF078|nr:hybrid sensor histidine kinase/response regulator transcription factor [Aestuariivivens sediminicola]
MINRKLWLLFLLLSLVSIFDSYSQIFTDFINTEYINADNGLSQSEVTSIIKDKKGFIWIGTRGGLNRYDGNTIKVFRNKIENSNSLINNSIETLFEDSDGYIWIGTKSNGVSRYNPEFHKFEQLPKVRSETDSLPLGDKRVVAIEEADSKEIWLGTWQNGFYILNQKRELLGHFLSDLKINDILKSKNGNIWVATNNGAYLFSSKGHQIKHIRFDGRNLEFNAIAEDVRTNLIYFVTWSEGVLEYDNNKNTFTQYKDHPNVDLRNTYYIEQISDGSMLIGTWGNGLLIFDPQTKEFDAFSFGKNHNRGAAELYDEVLYIFQDDLGILWFGTNGGVCKVAQKENQFESTQSSNLPNKPVWKIEKDFRNNIWVGLKGDKNVYYSEDNLTSFKKVVPQFKPDLLVGEKDHVREIYQARDSSLWLANVTSLYEIVEHDAKFSIVPIKIKDHVTSEEHYLTKITKLFQTMDGTFWIGTQQRGLRKSLNSGNPKTQSFKKYLNDQRISDFLQDSKERLWVGTYQGLKLYNSISDNFKTFNKIHGKTGTLSSDIIICLHEDKSGTLWVGTPNGLNKVIEAGNDKFIFKLYQEKDGLLDSYIHAILEDDNGNIWVSTNKGVSRFNKEDGLFYNYDTNSGLLSNTFLEDSAVNGSNGKLYFGSIYGINILDPETIGNSEIPPVVLTGLKVSGQEISGGTTDDENIVLEKAIEYNTEIILSHDNNRLTLEYAALDFLSSYDYSYNYMLEGLDSDWNTTTNENQITYSNLDAGEYIFKVKTINKNIQKETQAASLKITVLPVFWKTWQALVLYVLIFIGLLYLFKLVIEREHNLKNKLEISKLKRKKEEELIRLKTQFFTDVAHEFRTPLSLISGPVEMMMDDTLDENQRKGHLSTVYYHTQRLLNLVNQLLDFRKVESGKMKLRVAEGNFQSFAYEIYLSFLELAESRNINFQFNAEGVMTPLTYDRQKMEIVLCNLLSNAFKFSPDHGEIVLTVSTSNNKDESNQFPLGYCMISVKDNGTGISKEGLKLIFNRFYQISNTNSSSLLGTGIGLALVKSIVKLHKGLIEVESEEGEGSEFIVKLPLGNNHFAMEDFITDFKKAEDPVHYTVEKVVSFQNDVVKTRDDQLLSMLIVEDNANIRNFIKTLFMDTYNTMEAENGRIGFEKALKHLPDIIITDLAMPEVDGLMLCKNLRKTKETMHIPIVMLTARTSTVFQQQGYSYGADIYVTKPFNAALLKVQVQGLLTNRLKLREYFSKKITLQPTDVEVTSHDEEFINNAMKIVEENLLNENLNREFLADKLATSPSTLYRKIKTLTGQDTSTFVRSIRIKRAAQLILNKHDNIGSIGYAVGFNDLKYFRKCFKDQFGASPSKFSKESTNREVSG